jgi:hypothetical protein
MSGCSKNFFNLAARMLRSLGSAEVWYFFYIFYPHSLFIYLINTLSSAQLHCWFDTHNPRTWSWWFCDEPGFWFVSILCPWHFGSTFPGKLNLKPGLCVIRSDLPLAVRRCALIKLHVYRHVNPFWFKASFECQDRSQYCCTSFWVVMVLQTSMNLWLAYSTEGRS